MAALGICCCTRTFSSCGVQASHCSGFSFCRAQALGAWASVVAVHGLVALQDVGSFWPRNQTGIPCIARQIPNHRTTKKCLAIVLCCSFLFSFSSTLTFLPRVSSLTHPTLGILESFLCLLSSHSPNPANHQAAAGTLPPPPMPLSQKMCLGAADAYEGDNIRWGKQSSVRSWRV